MAVTDSWNLRASQGETPERLGEQTVTCGMTCVKATWGKEKKSWLCLPKLGAGLINGVPAHEDVRRASKTRKHFLQSTNASVVLRLAKAKDVTRKRERSSWERSARSLLALSLPARRSLGSSPLPTSYWGRGACGSIGIYFSVFSSFCFPTLCLYVLCVCVCAYY